MDEDLPTAVLVPTELVVAAPLEGMSAFQSVMEAPLESQRVASTDVIPSEAVLMTEIEAILDQLLE